MLMPMTRYQRQMTWKKRAETDGRALALSVTTQARPPDGWRGRDDGSEPRWRRWHVELSRWLSSRLHFVLDILVVVNFRATFWPEHSPLQASRRAAFTATAAAAAGGDFCSDSCRQRQVHYIVPTQRFSTLPTLHTYDRPTSRSIRCHVGV